MDILGMLSPHLDTRILAAALLRVVPVDVWRTNTAT